MFLLRFILIVLLARETLQYLAAKHNKISKKKDLINSKKISASKPITGEGITSVYIWDLTTGRLNRTLNSSALDGDYVMPIASFQNGIIAVGYEYGILFWNYHTGKVKYTYKDLKGYVSNLGDQQIAANLFFTGQVVILNVTTSEKLYTFQEEADDNIYTYPIVPLSNNFLAVGFKFLRENEFIFNLLNIYNLNNGEKMFSLNLLTDEFEILLEIKSLQFLAIETYGCHYYESGTHKVSVLNIKSREMMFTFESSYLICSLEDENFLVIQDTQDYSLDFVDPAKGLVMFSLTGHSQQLQSMLKIGENLYLSSDSNTTLIWNITSDSGSVVYIMTEAKGDCSFSYLENNLLSYSCDDDNIYVWNVTSKQVIYTLTQTETTFSGFLYAKLDDNLLATTSEYDPFFE